MSTAALILGGVTAGLGWLTWIFFALFAIYLVGFIFLLPPILAIVFGIIIVANAGDDDWERRKGITAILLGATGVFIGWFAFLFFLLLTGARRREYTSP